MSGRGRTTSAPTIYDVARRAGVSKSLVSLVLRDSDRVSERRREAVLDAIRELGYRPSDAASSLAGSRTRSIGVVIDDFENLSFVGVLRGMRRVLDGPGFHVSVADAELNAHLHEDPVDGFLSRRVEGLVVAREPGAIPLGELAVPYVVVGHRHGVPEDADLVTGDDAAGAGLAVRHLVGLGHTRIAHLTGSGGAAARRRRGYEEAMAAAGLAPLVGGEGGTTEEAGYAAAGAVLDAHPGTTAVFAANDTMALGVLAALRERGLSVPGDASVLGYDNSPLASTHYLDLTSVDDRAADVGAEAARALLARIEDPGCPPLRVLLEPAVVPRSSTGPARAS